MARRPLNPKKIDLQELKKGFSTLGAGLFCSILVPIIAIAAALIALLGMFVGMPGLAILSIGAGLFIFLLTIFFFVFVLQGLNKLKVTPVEIEFHKPAAQMVLFLALYLVGTILNIVMPLIGVPVYEIPFFNPAFTLLVQAMYLVFWWRSSELLAVLSAKYWNGVYDNRVKSIRTLVFVAGGFKVLTIIILQVVDVLFMLWLPSALEIVSSLLTLIIPVVLYAPIKATGAQLPETFKSYLKETEFGEPEPDRNFEDEV